MYLYQYILLAGFTCLLFFRETRFASSVFLSGWIVYLVSTIGMEYKFYFLASATIETAISYTLNKKHRLVSWLGYSLILVNISGLILHIYGIKLYYDVTYAVISVTQFLLLLARLLPSGILRLSEQCWLVRLINFDSGQARGIMCKNKATKEAHR